MKISIPVFQAIITEAKMDNNGNTVILCRCAGLTRARRYYKDELHQEAADLRDAAELTFEESRHMAAALATARHLGWGWAIDNVALGGMPQGYAIVQKS